MLKTPFLVFCGLKYLEGCLRVCFRNFGKYMFGGVL